MQKRIIFLSIIVGATLSGIGQIKAENYSNSSMLNQKIASVDPIISEFLKQTFVNVGSQVVNGYVNKFMTKTGIPGYGYNGVPTTTNYSYTTPTTSSYTYTTPASSYAYTTPTTTYQSATTSGSGRDFATQTDQTYPASY